MFFSRYPRTRLVYDRVLQSRGTPRGLTIVPLPGPGLEPPQIVHQGSAVVHSLEPGIAYVVEWTGDVTELHRVQL